MTNESNEMRQIMSLLEAYTSFGDVNYITEEVKIEESAQISSPTCSMEDLKDVVFKLRSYTSNQDGDRGLGIEEGMQLAADMIENLIRRIEGV